MWRIEKPTIPIELLVLGSDSGYTWERLERIEICPGVTSYKIALDGKAALYENYKVCTLIRGEYVKVSTSLYSPKPESFRTPFLVEYETSGRVRLQLKSGIHDKIDWQLYGPMNTPIKEGQLSTMSRFREVQIAKLPHPIIIEWSSSISYGTIIIRPNSLLASSKEAKGKGSP